MVLEKRQCPNCGSAEVLEKDGTFVCMNCRTFFDNPNDLKITHTTISRNETEIERIKAKERAQKEDNKHMLIILVIVFGMFLLIGLSTNLFPAEKEVKPPVTRDGYYTGATLEKVLNDLTDAGFTDIETIALKDLDEGHESSVNLVKEVTIGGESNWASDIFGGRKSYKVSTPVKIYYHTMKEDGT